MKPNNQPVNQFDPSRDCFKLASLYREKDYSTEYLVFYLFPNRLVEHSSKSSKLKEYSFDNSSEVEKKFDKILKRKLSIGFSIINDNIDPIFYNLFNLAMIGFDAIKESEKNVQFRFRFNRIMDSVDNSYLRYFSLPNKEFLQRKFNGKENLVNLFSTFGNFDFQIDLNRNGFQFVYRFSLMYWDQTKWSSKEPDDKFDCDLGKSILTFISENEPPKKQRFWSKIIKKLKHSPPAKERYHFLSKGLISFLDLNTEKIYLVEDYEPPYDKPIRPTDILVYDDTVKFMTYIWKRLEEDIFYSMKYN